VLAERRIMNSNTDQFQKDLRENLSIIATSCDRFIAIVNGMMSGTEQELLVQLMEIDNAIEQNRTRIAAARAELDRSIETDKLETSKRVSNWKAKRQTDRLHARADRYERCAKTSVEIAAATMDEAGQWVFRALLARKEAISIQTK
jgi:hypothetical protein